MSPNPKDILSKFITDLKLGTGETVLCAVSGGADSMCLLVLMHELGVNVVALHCNHQLRGKASDLDQRVVQALCDQRGIELVLFKKAMGKGSGLEARCRNWRRECYGLSARRYRARFVLLAHHARDQAETLLLNLIRGAGLKGALAMQPLAPLEGSSAELGRPFLGLMPDPLKAALKSRKLSWREDASNKETRFARNAIRHKVLPLLESLVPGATSHLAAFTRRARGSGLPGLDDPGLQRVKALLKKGSGSVDLKGGLALEASAGSLRLKPLLKIERRRVGKDWQPEANAFWFSNVSISKDLKVRAARAGDRFRPFGMKGSRRVFDLLAQHKVPAWRRDGWPLLVSGKTAMVLGVLGVRQAEAYRIGPSTKEALRVTWGSFDKAGSLC